MEPSIYLEGDWRRDKRRLTDERLQTAKYNIYENALNVAEKTIDKQMQERLRKITRQALFLRQKIKEFTLEKKQAQLELKKRYFPDNDFKKDESRLKSSVYHLGLSLDRFYLDKNQRYPLRLVVSKSAKLNVKHDAKSYEPTEGGYPMITNNSVTDTPKKRSHTRSRNRIQNNKRRFDYVSIKTHQDPRFNQQKSLPELPASNKNKEPKISMPMEPHCTNDVEERESKLPMLQNEGTVEYEQNIEGIRREPLKSPDLPHIIEKDKQHRECRNGKEYSIEILKFNHIRSENLRMKMKETNYKIKQFLKEDNNPTTTENSLTSTNTEEDKVLDGIPSDYENFIVNIDDWKLTKSLKKESAFSNKIALMTLIGFQHDKDQNSSMIPLNTAKRALRHMPSKKMQDFIKELVSQD